MTTYPTPFLFDASSGGVIPPETRAYFEDRLRYRLHDLVVREFKKQQQESGLTQKDVAARLKKRPEQVNRWLSGPSNWTLNTVSNLLLAICQAELNIGVSVLSEQPARNRREPEWLTARPPEPQTVRTTAGYAPFATVQVQQSHFPAAMPASGAHVLRAEAISAGKARDIRVREGGNGRL